MSSAYTTIQSQSDPQSIQRMIQGITTNIQRIAQNVNQIGSLNLQIGTAKDSEELRDKL